MVITEEVTIVVCAAIVQLTFGMKKYKLDNIKAFIFTLVFFTILS